MKVVDEAFEELDQQATKVAALKEEVKEHKDARMRMEGALSYVKE